MPEIMIVAEMHGPRQSDGHEVADTAFVTAWPYNLRPNTNRTNPKDDIIDEDTIPLIQTLKKERSQTIIQEPETNPTPRSSIEKVTSFTSIPFLNHKGVTE